MEFKFNRNKEKGFTLVEVLISLALLAIGLLAAATLQTTAILGNKTSNEMSMGTLLGQQALEQLMTYNASTNLSLCGTCAPNAPSGVHTAATETILTPPPPINGIVYNRSYTVATDTPITGIRTITMTIQWTDKSNHQVNLVGRTTP
ncbi:MAG TPA: prepilin-type N-terminal cleavage/methylation domain-containing protein [Nitrospiria bacterium]|nr:prepilin-type N-terminal cleavage/methylation domain-containing protein [Nitrospiria bacterium]